MKKLLDKIINDILFCLAILAFFAMLILSFMLPFLLVGAAAYWTVYILRWAATL